MSDDDTRLAWLLRAGMVSLAVVVASACAPEFDAESCSKDSDCFRNERCVDGACQRIASDDGEIADLNIEPATAEAQVGSTIQLTATARDSDGDDVSVPSEVTWSSSDTDIATVEEGESPDMVDVTGESAGTAVISASLEAMDATASVTVTEESVNNEPVADAGADQTVTVGTSVELDGSASMDPDGDQLTYEWAFTSSPSDSSASLEDASTVQPTFTPDVAGDYEIELTVSDENASDTDSVVVTAESGGMDGDAGMDTGPEVGDTGADTGLDTQSPLDTSDPDTSDTSSTDTSDTTTSPMDTSDTDTSTMDTSDTTTSPMDTSDTTSTMDTSDTTSTMDTSETDA